MLCKLNHDVLASIFDERLVVFQLPSYRPVNLRESFNVFRGYIDGLSSQTIDDAILCIQTENVCKVFVDGSNLGAFVSALKRQLKDVEVTTFFHNVEARFFWGSLFASPSPRALAVLIINFLAERAAVCFSDKRICLSERDSHLLKRLYGKGATHIAPIALEDKILDSSITEYPVQIEGYALFVGGNFYANRVGITWFVKKVAPRVNIKICVVGKGMENMRAELQIPGRVDVIGTVANLSEWYLNALFVIAPIFDGSGMKTKVAEALMYGKKVIGTPEAFSGYEHVIGRAGWCCSSPSDFIYAIDVACKTISSGIDPEMRDLYSAYFSFNSSRLRLIDALCKT